MQENTRPTVYVSYSQKQENNIKLLGSLQDRLPDIEFRIDTATIEDTQDFMDFIHELQAAEYIIVILSEAYFQSFHCMYELTGIVHHDRDFKERTFPR